MNDSERLRRTDVPASNGYRYSSIDGPRDRSLRVGERERDAVGEILRRRHLEGRLDTEELEARLERCLAAKSYAQLDELIADFPPEDEDRARSGSHRRFRPWPPAFFVLPAILIAAIAFGGHAAWLVVPLFFFFVVRPLLWHGRVGGYRRRGWAGGPRHSTRI